MGIVSLVTDTAGQVDVNPRRVKMISTDNLSKITAAGYLNKEAISTFPIYPTDIFDVIYSYVQAINTGTYAEFSPVFNNGVITLTAITTGAGVITPTVLGDVAVFQDTKGTIGEGIDFDLVTVPAPLQVNGLLILGTIGNGSFTIQNNNNTENPTLFIDNMAQSTNFSLNDPGVIDADLLTASTGTITAGNVIVGTSTEGLLADGGFQIHAGTTAPWTGGGTTHSFTTTNMTASSIVTAVILSSANSVSINQAVPGTNTLDVTFSADPGTGTTVSWVSVTPAV